MEILVAELQDKLLLDLIEVNQFILQDVHHHPCLVQSLHLHIRDPVIPSIISVTATHVFKAGLLQDLSVLLDGVEVVVPALDVLLEVVAVRLVSVTVVRDQKTTAGLQSSQELGEEFVLLRDVEDGVATVDDVVEVVRVVHGEGVLNVELGSVLHGRLHLLPVVVSDGDHVGGQVDTVNIHHVAETV